MSAAQTAIVRGLVRMVDDRGARARRIGPARWLIAGLCAAVAACAFIVRPMVASNAPGSLAKRADAEINVALRTPRGVSKRRALAEAERITLIELSRSPARSGAWARLAYARSLADGALTPSATEALLTSYDAAPYESELMLWRTAFVFGNWPQANLPLREAAFEEANAFGRFNVQRQALAKIPPLLDDPSGRFALMVALEGGPGG